MTTTTPIPTYALKFILVGDVGVGKSQLARRFAKDKFDADAQSTVGMEFSTKILYIGKNFIRAQVLHQALDCSNRLKYTALCPSTLF